MSCCIKHTAGGGTKFEKRGFHKKGVLGTLYQLWLLLYLALIFVLTSRLVKDTQNLKFE